MSKRQAKYKALLAMFKKEKIKSDAPGFFDSPNFLKIEKRDPEFLDNYARYVQWREYDGTYLARAERVIRIVSEEMHRGLLLEGRLGGCIDTSMTLARILDRHGVWNWVVRGALAIHFPPATGEEPFHFQPIDMLEATAIGEPGHKWVYAPPFCVVDLTLKQQDYPRPKIRDFLPEMVLAKTSSPTSPTPEELMGPTIRKMAASMGHSAKDVLPQVASKYVTAFAPDFPSHLIEIDGLKMKYIPTGVGGSDKPLEQIAVFNVQGRPAIQFYENDIKPKLEAAGL